MRVGLDLDGVCYDFAASLRRYLTHRLGWDPVKCPDATRWTFYEDWGLTSAEFLDTCADGVNAGVIFTWGEPYPGTREAVERIKAAGHTIHVITDRSFGRPGLAARATIAWLAKHRIPFDTITFSPDKTIVRTDVMVDDKLENYDALDRVGCWAYLLDRPWNQAKNPPRFRVPDLAAFADEVLNPERIA